MDDVIFTMNKKFIMDKQLVLKNNEVVKLGPNTNLSGKEIIKNIMDITDKINELESVREKLINIIS